MKQGVIKISMFVIAFFATTFLINSQNEPAMAFELPTSVTLNCVDNAVAPLNNLKEIQTFLSCNGFNPGPIDGIYGRMPAGAVSRFQVAKGLTQSGIWGSAEQSAAK